MPKQSLDTESMDKLNDELEKVKDLAYETDREAKTVENMASKTEVSYGDLKKKMAEAIENKTQSESEVQGIRLSFIYLSLYHKF